MIEQAVNDKESGFSVGDNVQYIENNHFYTVEKKNTEYFLTSQDHTSGFWTDEKNLRDVEASLPRRYLGDTPARPIPSDGSDGKYYDRTIPKNILEKWNGTRVVSAEDLIYVVFRNDFNFGNSFKSLVRADSFVRGIGKQGNTLKYECNKVHYYTDKIEEQGDNK